MGGRRAGLAEIGQALDDARAELVLPDAVDVNPRRQRVVGPSQPAGEGQTPSCLFGAGPGRLNVEGCLAVGQHGRHARADQPAGAQIIAPSIYISWRWL